MGGYTRKARAARTENELANMLWSYGYAVVRGPSSGSGVRKRFHPDLVAIKSGKVLVIEVKAGHSSKPIYVRRSQVEGLREFAARAGGMALIAVRVAGSGWRFHPLERLEETPSGNLKINDPAHGGLKLIELEEILFPKSKRLTEFMNER